MFKRTLSASGVTRQVDAWKNIPARRGRESAGPLHCWIVEVAGTANNSDRELESFVSKPPTGGKDILLLGVLLCLIRYFSNWRRPVAFAANQQLSNCRLVATFSHDRRGQRQLSSRGQGLPIAAPILHFPNDTIPTCLEGISKPVLKRIGGILPPHLLNKRRQDATDTGVLKCTLELCLQARHWEFDIIH